jgi:predicted metal-dependent phosphoesterase TrpH
VRDYIRAPWEELPAEYLDGIEVHNACNDDLSNLRAQALAEKHGLIAVAGSDAHTPHTRGLAGIACDKRIRTERELVATLRDEEYDLYIAE